MTKNIKIRQLTNDISKVIGENIRRLRRDAGLTQAELAARVKIRPEPLGCIERGQNAPSAPVLQSMAAALQVSIDTLFAASPAAFQALRESSMNRPWPILPDLREVPDDTWALADTLVDDFLALEEICGARKHAVIPLHLNLQPDEPGMEKLAAAVRGFMGIGSGVVFDYCELFENCGFRVVFLPLPLKLDSFSYFDPLNENALFFINSCNTPEKQLFSLAFELGLIYLRSAPRLHPLAAADCPHLARKFAAFFLMPPAAVNATVDQLGVTPAAWTYELLLRIKHRFGVSAETFLYRLHELDRITPELCQELKLRIYSHYGQTGYAEPDSTRRVFTPNGRLWDLVLLAGPAAAKIKLRLRRKQIPSEPENRGQGT
jgi:transcriptional regulator with XRE-family HTH domain/Zn-dependent peptidase ImmA (M78 family)